MRKLKYVKLFEAFSSDGEKLITQETSLKVRKDEFIKYLDKLNINSKIFIKKDSYFSMGKGSMIIIISDMIDKYINGFKKEDFREVTLNDIIEYFTDEYKNQTIEVDSEIFVDKGQHKGIIKIK